MASESKFTLPRRNTGSYLKALPRQTLRTNLYKVEFEGKCAITIYSVTVDPPLPYDSSKLNVIVSSVEAELRQQIGNFLISGRNIYGCQASKSKEPFTLGARLGAEKYSLQLKSIRSIDLSALNSAKSSDSLLPLNFLSNLVKKFFASMKYVTIGKSGRYFNPKSRKVLSSSGIVLFNGFETKLNMTEAGLYLQVDSMVRIVQTKTVLEQINEIYAKSSQLSKDEKRNAVKNKLVGRQVMANYGNSRIWKIEDVIFDFDLEATKIGQEDNMNFFEYYQKNYNLSIRNKKQPVLKATLNGSRKSPEARDSILIPQFLMMSGLPEDFDERKRRDISQYTIIQPEEKLNRIQSLMSSFNENQNFCPNSVSQSLGVKFSPTTETVEAFVLAPPTLRLGKQDFVEKSKVASFQIFNKQLYRHSVPVNIVVFLPTDYDFSQTDKLFASTCKNLGLKHNINIIRLNFQDPRKCLADIQRYIEDKEGKLDDYDLNWFILTPNFKQHYKTIKRLSLKGQNPKATQVALTSTLARKGFASILTKILIQISSKVGNVAWSPKIPAMVSSKTILIGIDFCKDTGTRGNTVAAYCCTTDKDMSQFHSNYHYQEASSKASTRIREIISDCLAAYGKLNTFLPEEIIILKADLSDGEKDFIVYSEITEVQSLLKEMNGYSPRLTFMTVNKHSKQKFFLEGRSIGNPGYGTLINSKVVSKFYDFYLIAQHCNRGTVKPVHYKVLYTDSAMEEGVLQELMYVQSFNYMNWSGSVRVPSVLQYATKLSSFVAQHISQAAQTTHLNQLLYYI